MRYHKRGFLNKETGMAAFEATIDFDDEAQYKYVSADFTISDCHRQINLEFTIDEKDDIPVKLEKLQKLIDEFVEFRNFLIVAAQRFGED